MVDELEHDMALLAKEGKYAHIQIIVRIYYKKNIMMMQKIWEHKSHVVYRRIVHQFKNLYHNYAKQDHSYCPMCEKP